MAAKLFGVTGAVMGFLSVALGAFGAHALRRHFEAFPSLQSTFETATHYQMVHALALLAVMWAAQKWPNQLFNWAGYLFIAGIILFSGSLYILSTTGIRWLGAITPLGGVAFLAGWLCLAIGIWRS